MAEDPSQPAILILDARYLQDMPRLKRRLVSRTGSIETAEDLLHDIWLRLRGRAGDANGRSIRSPGAYLSRIADNLALDDARARARRLRASEVEQLLEPLDERPTAERVVIARDEMRAVTAALAALPERRRAIFVAARLQGERYASIAARHGITTRTVENEVRRVLDHVAAQLDDRTG